MNRRTGVKTQSIKALNEIQYNRNHNIPKKTETKLIVNSTPIFPLPKPQHNTLIYATKKYQFVKK